METCHMLAQKLYISFVNSPPQKDWGCHRNLYPQCRCSFSIHRINISYIVCFFHDVYSVLLISYWEVKWASYLENSMGQLGIICAMFLELKYISRVNFNSINLFLQKLFQFFEPIGKLGFLTSMFNGPTRVNMRNVSRVKIHI